MKPRILLALLPFILAGCTTATSSSSVSSTSEESQGTSSEASSSETSSSETVPSSETESSESVSSDVTSSEEPSSEQPSESETSSAESSEVSSSEVSSGEESSSEVVSSEQSSKESSSEVVSSEQSSDESSSEQSSDEPSSSEKSSETSSSSSEKTIDEWNLVTSVSDLEAGDVVVLANAEKGVVAGSYSSNSSALMVTESEPSFSSDYASIEVLPEDATVFTLGKSGSYWTLSSEEGTLKSTTKSNKPALSYSSGDEKWDISVSSGEASIVSATSTYGILEYNPTSPRFKTYKSTTKGMKPINLYKGGTSTPVWPTSVTMKGESEVSAGKTLKLTLDFTPANTNRKEVTWTSSDAKVATVSDGVVRAIKEGEATITAKVKKEDGTFLEASKKITVTEAKLDDYTIMLYVCGADLESYDSEYRQYGSQASANLAEIVSVDLPDGVNFLVETGGANNWDPAYAETLGASIPKALTRWTVEDHKLVKEDSSLQPKDASMGLTNTFQDFMTWGLENYPAEKTGVIFWNHGGALDGCCFDERFSDDPLTPEEVHSAFKTAFSSTGTDKLEWVGYDCCLMGVQDIAELNSDYFDYMIASQETEPGGGWDYDVWLKTLADDPSLDTVTLGKSICDSYSAKCKASYEEIYEYDPVGYAEYKDFNDATLSLLDLSKMEAYRDAFENMASDLSSIITSQTKWNNFATLVNKSEKYGVVTSVDWALDFNDGYLYDVFNLSTFLKNLKASSTYSSVRVDDVVAAMNDLIVYNVNGKDSPNACGLCFYCPISGYNEMDLYTNTGTRFSTWLALVNKYGSFYQG